MSIDSLGRESALAARSKATQEVDTVMMLERLQHTHRNRRIATAVLGTAAAATAIVLVVHGVVTSTDSSFRPGGVVVSRSPHASASCPQDTTCLGGAHYRVALPAPVTVDLPDSFEGAFARFGVGTVEDYRSDVVGTGVTVMENARPLKADATWSVDPTVGTTARAMATWLVHRPFLVHARMTPTTVGGRAAWVVTGDLKPGALLPAAKADGAAVPTFGNDAATSAYGVRLAGEYTLLDVPGAGVTVIWSWTSPGTRAALDGNRAYVEGLSFG